jgi:hypothetical protein
VLEAASASAEEGRPLLPLPQIILDRKEAGQADRPSRAPWLWPSRRRNRETVKKVVAKEKLTWRSFWDGGSTDGPITRAVVHYFSPLLFRAFFALKFDPYPLAAPAERK